MVSENRYAKYKILMVSYLETLVAIFKNFSLVRRCTTCCVGVEETKCSILKVCRFSLKKEMNPEKKNSLML